MSKANLSRLRSDPVRIAAFCFKNLKRTEVLDTDISSAVDKILQEMDVVSYRVLGYLLVGIIRIFSKKVEYVLEDCNEVLIKINKFVVNKEGIVRVETLRMPVTIPDRLELDVFELDELENVDRGHTAPPEEITLRDKENVCKTEGFGLFSHEKFEEFDVAENTSSFDQDIVGNAFLSKLLNMMDIEVSPQNSPTDLLLESWDKFQSSISAFQEKVPIEDERLSVIPPKSKNLDATPQSKFQGVGRPKQDSATPESMHVSTPAVREQPPFSRKRRVGLDRMIVLSNKAVIKNIKSAKDLVRFPFPRESRRTLLNAHCVQRQRESPISSSSSELQLLFSKKKMKLPNSLKIVETPGNLDVPESPIAGTPLSPSQSSDSLEIEETRRETNSRGTNESELLAGWSGRTREVASCLHQSFLHARKQREDTVNFSQVFGGRARKESALLFYEVLVLKTTGYVDVEQNKAYGDIAISRLPKLDQTFLFDGLLE
ncbi:Sister chromatid cohesion 1 protein 2 [Glycine max]|nr:Sister chromatid cohesion 1 protein 2 [Glycine max]KAH1193762.1 Sister chromatid cohesion 1 protein 2 [Glycine max]